MLWTPKAPTITPRPLGTPLPRKLPISLHPSCVLAYLPQNDPKWFDYSGHDRHGIVHGATPTAKGQDGFAWEFDGVDDHIGFTVPLDIARNGFTINIRFYWFGYRGQVAAVLFNIGNDLGSFTEAIDMIINPENILALRAFRSGSRASHIIATERWFNATGTIDILGRVTLFVDGHLRGKDTGSLTNLGIGKGAIGKAAVRLPEFFFHGFIDSVFIYNQAWSPRPADANYLPEIDPFLGGF